MGDPSRLIQSQPTLERPNTMGVYSNEWSIPGGYYITYTKRFMSTGGLSSHIYDVG